MSHAKPIGVECSMRHRTTLIASLASLVLAASASGQATTPDSAPARRGRGSSAHHASVQTHTRALASTVEAIVHEGGHAGIVVKLESVVGLETMYPVSAVFTSPRWYVRLPAVAAPVRALLALHEGGSRQLEGPGPRLVDQRATRCLALLRQPVRRVYVGSFHHVFIATSANALGRAPVFGTVGSGVCRTPERLHWHTVVGSGPTYMDALDQIVAQAGGVAWVAAENGRGQCGIGLVVTGQPLLEGIDCLGSHLLELPPTTPLRR